MIIKIAPVKEKVRSMIRLIEDREKFISSVVHTINTEEFSTIIAETYYEIIKELATAVLLSEGFKATGENAHKDLMDYLSNYREFSEDEVILLNDLRIKRNKSSYEGKEIDKSYLENKKDKLLIIIKKLKKLVDSKL